jgi:hypothetical protein
VLRVTSILAASVAFLFGLLLGFWGVILVILGWVSDEAHYLTFVGGIPLLISGFAFMWLARYLYSIRV